MIEAAVGAEHLEHRRSHPVEHKTSDDDRHQALCACPGVPARPRIRSHGHRVCPRAVRGRIHRRPDSGAPGLRVCNDRAGRLPPDGAATARMLAVARGSHATTSTSQDTLCTTRCDSDPSGSTATGSTTSGLLVKWRTLARPRGAGSESSHPTTSPGASDGSRIAIMLPARREQNSRDRNSTSAGSRNLVAERAAARPATSTARTARSVA
jgi:hypothetical protein